MPAALGRSGDDLALSDWMTARRILTSRHPHLQIELYVLHPVYPAAGAGKLRVLRVIPLPDRLQVLAGYESYERLG